MDNAPIVALELGTTKTRVLVAEPREDDHLNVIGLGEAISSGIRKSEVVHMANAMASLRTALHGAEETADVGIRQVHLLVSGGHIQAKSNRGSIPLIDSGSISKEDVEHVSEIARAVSLPSERQILHTITQHFYIDGHQGVVSPVNMEGSRLDVDMLILHGVRNRLRNVIKVARDIPLDVPDVAFSGLCAALAVLSPEEKQNGAVVIDLGGGTTSYAAYAAGMFATAGSFGVGGDHLTNDLARGLRLTLSQAEALKEEYGSAVVDRAARTNKVEVAADTPGAASRIVRLGDVQLVTNARIEEILSMVKTALVEADLLHHLDAGVILTGGGAHLRDVARLASAVFGLPCSIGRPRDVSGLTTDTAGPEYAAPLGMLRYVQRNHRRKQRPKWTLPGLFGR